ncbi:hypothetical protein BCR44DRAFT_1442329, partial [Catenaria anguillulae PL171]
MPSFPIIVRSGASSHRFTRIKPIERCKVPVRQSPCCFTDTPGKSTRHPDTHQRRSSLPPTAHAPQQISPQQQAESARDPHRPCHYSQTARVICRCRQIQRPWPRTGAASGNG